MGLVVGSLYSPSSFWLGPRQDVFATSPSACSTRQRKLNPLHILLQLAPDTAKVTNNKGILPLEVFIDSEPTWEKGLRDLLYCYPRGIFEVLLEECIFDISISSWSYFEPRERFFRDGITFKAPLDVIFELIVDRPDIIS